jgi:hypothetical protein
MRLIEVLTIAIEVYSISTTTIITVAMSSSQPSPSTNLVIDLDPDDDALHSGETPTLPADEAPTIKALLNAANDSEYDLCIAQIPRDHKLRINGVTYVKYDPYRPRKSKRSAWYWNPLQGEELIRTKKGMMLF